ncbi:MAG: GvpL/GvpF family gas vesicle protein, partial [Candidatus Micrarchaeota archaeon]
DTGDFISLGKIGIEENNVYTIPHLGISAVVHNCLPKAYDSKDENVIINYAQAHNSVIDLAFNKFNAAVPLRFDTIIKEKDSGSNEAVQKWLEEQHPDLERKLNELRGKQEYGVQVFMDRERLLQDILNKNERVAELKKKMEAADSPGHAYLCKQTFESVVKKELGEKTSELAKEVQSIIKNCCSDMRSGKTRKADGKTMLLNVSCLIQKENAAQFKEELEKMDDFNNLSGRITGPWAPYSFL